jgi:hypothetical protein
MHTLGVGVSSIERNAVLVIDRGVEGTLHIVDRLWHQVQAEFFVPKEVV